jgi:hypothetical protein
LINIHVESWSSDLSSSLIENSRSFVTISTSSVLSDVCLKTWARVIIDLLISNNNHHSRINKIKWFWWFRLIMNLYRIEWWE